MKMDQANNRDNIDYHEILLTLTSSNTEEAENFGDKLQRLLQKTLPLLPEDVQNAVINSTFTKEITDIRYQYLYTLVFVLQMMQKCNATDSNVYFSVNQFLTIKVAFELITSIGIIPCLLFGVGIDMAKYCPRALKLCQESITDIQKYDRICFSVKSLIDLYDEVMLRPMILYQLGPLLAALLQLSYAPLMKPSENQSTNEQQNNKTQFKMTVNLYKKLKNDQAEFQSKLLLLLNNCPQAISIKELMVILGLEGAPIWLRKETRKCLIERIIQPNGIIAIIDVVCDNALDIGIEWNKLDVISRLIAASHGKNPNEYYNAVCSQLIDLLMSKKIKHSSTIANCCITALYEHNPDICQTHIIEKISACLLNIDSDTARSESEIEQCIEYLTRCFVTVEAKFEHLPCRVISKTAVPLFCLYNKTRQSASILKNKIKQLLLLFLYDESLRKDLFSVFLGHNKIETFGDYVKSEFGPTGGLVITGIEQNINYEQFADSLFDLVSTAEVPSNPLFCYLLEFLSNFTKFNSQDKENLLETTDDAMDRIEKQLVAVKLLSNLANTSTVQAAQIKNPEYLFSFIKTLFEEYTKSNQATEDQDCEILYISLMLIKMILSEKKKGLDWRLFNDFAMFLRDHCNISKIPSQLSSLGKEVLNLIVSQGRSEQKCYQDLSKDSKASSKFEEAIKDLSDPLLPVRAHGLIVLTKLIETKDPCATARRAIILQMFQENIKHEDSFIYLAAINGLCALASMYPQIVLETLIQEYIDMPQRIGNAEITVETRVKIGEILVKATRALGDMASAHKNVLINGFLCATRDSDSLVRASSLSCLGELCKIMGFRLGNVIVEILYCITCIIKSDKVPECRRAAVLVATLLLRGLGKDALTSLGNDLVGLFRALKHLRDNDDDPVLRLHSQLALEEIDEIVQNLLFSKPKLQKTIFLLDSP